MASEIVYEPYSLNIQGALDYFGVTKKEMNRWLYGGYLTPGIHFLRVGRKPLILRKAFNVFLNEQLKSQVYTVAEFASIFSVDKRTVYKWLMPEEGEPAIPPDGWYTLPTNKHIRIREWVIEGLQTGEFRRPDDEGPQEYEAEAENEIEDPHPYSLSINGASAYFGPAKQTLYKWISEGRLHRGYHYLKVGRKPLIIHDAFVEFMRQEDGYLREKQAAAPRDGKVEPYRRRVGRRNFD